jgi:hypothetical protein
VYARQVDDKTLTLFVSGYLLHDSLVMQDQETNSYWSQILGEAKAGPLKGKKLQPIPAVVTDWQSWSKQHPEATVVVLDRHSTSYRRQSFDPPRQFVLGVVINEKVAAWRLDLLAKTPVRNEQVGENPLLITFDQKSDTARVYERGLDGRTLTFRLMDHQLTDQETGSTWDPVVGRAVAGTLKGKHLLPLPATVCYADAWKDFHPGSEIHSAE